MKKLYLSMWGILFAASIPTCVFAEYGSAGSIETGLYTGVSFPDAYLGLQPKNAVMAGARLGGWVTNRISVEGSFQRAFSSWASSESLYLDSTRLNVLYHLFPHHRFRPFLTVGTGWEASRIDAQKNQHDIGFNAGLGANLFLDHAFSLRIEGRYNRIDFNQGTSSQKQNNFELMIGLSRLWREKKAQVVPLEPVAVKPLPVIAPPTPTPVVPKDSDQDGIVDEKDACDQTTLGVKVDERGCEVMVDSDGDAVLDNQDKCPKTPAGIKVDTSGCPVMAMAKAKGVLLGVTFKPSSHLLTEVGKSTLIETAKALNEIPSIPVEVQGYSDSKGNPNNNIALSQKRAESVVEFLRAQGVSGERLSAKGFGPENPIADNQTKIGRAKNRRVEIKWLEENK